MKDWYNAERRFIFATKTEQQRQRWLDEIMKEKACSAITKNRVSAVSDKLLSHSPASGNILISPGSVIYTFSEYSTKHTNFILIFFTGRAIVLETC